MNICVTGALGHIGSALIRHIGVPVKKIILIDNLATQRYCSLFNLPKKYKYQFVEMDILAEEIESIIKQVDVVVHLAAITDAQTSYYRPELVKKVNEEGIHKIAHLCLKHGCKLIFPSTTSVYGVTQTTIDESCLKKQLQPQSPYAKSKLFGEILLQSLSKKGLKCVILRLGTIFGFSPGMRFHTVVNKFVFQACIGQPLTVWKTAYHQKRPYCDINDALSAINQVIRGQIFNGEIYNIVTINLAVANIINIIKSYTPSVKYKLIDSPIMNKLSYEVSNQKSKDIGFQYKGDIKESIKQMVVVLNSLYF